MRCRVEQHVIWTNYGWVRARVAKRRWPFVITSKHIEWCPPLDSLEWDLTHVPTGMAIAVDLTVPAALSLMEELRPLLRWQDLGRDGLPPDHPRRAPIFEAIERARAKSGWVDPPASEGER